MLWSLCDDGISVRCATTPGAFFTKICARQTAKASTAYCIIIVNNELLCTRYFCLYGKRRYRVTWVNPYQHALLSGSRHAMGAFRALALVLLIPVSASYRGGSSSVVGRCLHIPATAPNKKIDAASRSNNNKETCCAATQKRCKLSIAPPRVYRERLLTVSIGPKTIVERNRRFTVKYNTDGSSFEHLLPQRSHVRQSTFQ